MRKLKLYLETTIFNYYFDEDRDAHKSTVQLFEEIKQGKYYAYTSPYVTDELEECDEPKKSKMITLIKEYNIIMLKTNNEVDRLADTYIKEKMIPENSEYDSLHIAVASINDLDMIVSLNFNHINRIRTKDLVELINKKEGYKGITIVSPMEVVGDEKT